MEYKKHTLQTRDSYKLFCQWWKPQTHQPQGLVVLVHGLGEHSGRYARWAERFVHAGKALFAFDLRGHGKSDGKRGDSPSYASHLNDIELALSYAQSLFSGLPVFLYGHSMGGNLALNYALRQKPPISGIVLTSPWLRLVHQPPKWLAIGAIALNAIVPALLQNTGLKAEDISHLPDEVKAYKDDPLVHSKLSIRNFLAIEKAAEYAIENAKTLDKPLLLMHGTGDKITSHLASSEFCHKAGQKAELKLWKGLFHELHHEEPRKEIFDFALQWINNHS